jgi:DNA helicase-2/ATP-dependent DNA helicase PcrA
VQIITIHSAKGLEWDDVAVVDLVCGGFPVREAAGGPSSGWLTGNGVLPWPARGDTDSLPVWRPAGAVSKDDAKRRWTEFREQAGVHAAAEERRLAYVALTRPRRSLLGTGARWGEGSRPREASPFLVEAREVGVPVLGWYEPEPPADGRDRGQPPRGARAADAVARQPAAGGGEGAGRPPRPCARCAPRRPPPPARPAVDRPWGRLVDALLAERARAAVPQVPVHLSASEVVAVAADARAALADLARPVPRRPSRQARRGSRFHEWVEARSGPRHGLFEPEELYGAADDTEADDVELRLLKQRFEASDWAAAEVVAVEVPFATPLDLPSGRVVLRGRVDAVVRSDDPRFDLDVVDWKTGRPPSGPDVGARDVQLAVYRLAVSRLHDVPLDRVGAAFWYGSVAPAGLTRRPDALLDEVGLVQLLGSLHAS